MLMHNHLPFHPLPVCHCNSGWPQRLAQRTERWLEISTDQQERRGARPLSLSAPPARFPNGTGRAGPTSAAPRHINRTRVEADGKSKSTALSVDHPASQRQRQPRPSEPRRPVAPCLSEHPDPARMAESAAPKSSSSAAAAGRKTRVGPYELGKTIGEGSFAKVKLARDSRTGAVCAIKVLDRNHVLRHKMVEQIKREISTMKLIKHPNVVQLHEVMASKTKIYMVLEYVDGGELFDKIVNSGRLSEDEARRYFHQLINAVDYCHSRGVYHRDLKPENLLLDLHGTLKVSDFGLSAFAPQTKEDGLLHTACGTPNYVAPEVLADKGYNGMAADVWSCGIILFVLMAGYLPFDDSNLMRLYKLICQANVSCPPWFSSGAKKFIKRIIDPNPDTRITIAEILEDEWFKKDYKPPRFEQGEDVSLDDVDAVFNDSEEHLVSEKREKPESMNAFALISRSQGFNLGNLFEKEMMGMAKRETSFTSQCTAQEIMSKIEEACGPLGFNVRKQNYKMKLKGDKTGRKGHLSVATEVFEVAPSLHMVELRKTGGDTLEFHNFYKNFSTELKDIVWKAESDTSKKQTK